MLLLGWLASQAQAAGYSEGAKPVFQATKLSADAGIYLKPAPLPGLSASLDPAQPVYRDLGTVWSLDKFKAGRAPLDLGPTPAAGGFNKPRNLRVLDLPLKMAGGAADEYRLPRELASFSRIIQRIIDIEHALVPPETISKYHAYLTIDQSYVEAGKYQRQPGAHVDGFQGASINPKNEVNHSYIVFTLTPTVFYTHFFDFSHLTDGVHDFFSEMDRQADERYTLRARPRRIYLMDGYSVHRAEPARRGGYRTFLRFSYDREVFNRKGNTRNPLFTYDWEMTEKRTADAFVPYAPPQKKFPETSGQDVIAFLSQDGELAGLFAGAAGVREGYTVAEHTLRVFTALEEFKPERPLNSLRGPEPMDFTALLKVAVALHDIGKPLAVQAGDKRLQHAYTLPILVRHMKRLGFRKAEINVVQALVGNDVLGQLVKGLISLDKAYARIQKLSASARMSQSDFFTLQSLFYMADASSYPNIRQEAFEKRAGKLRLKSRIFAALRALALKNSPTSHRS